MTKITILITGLAAIGLMSCGENKSDSSGSGLTSDNASSVGSFLNSSASSAANSMSGDQGLGASSLLSSGLIAMNMDSEQIRSFETQITSCVPTETGDASDDDDDGISENLAISFAPCSGDGITGSATEVDADDTDETSGFSADITNLRWDLGSGSSMTFNVDLDLTKGAGTYTMSQSFQMTLAGTSETATIATAVSLVYTPDNASLPFGDSGTEATGDISLTGSITVSGTDIGLNSVTFSGTDLQFEEECGAGSEPGFSGGSLSLTSDGHTVQIVYGASCAYTVYYDGTIVTK